MLCSLPISKKKSREDITPIMRIVQLIAKMEEEVLIFLLDLITAINHFLLQVVVGKKGLVIGAVGIASLFI